MRSKCVLKYEQPHVEPSMLFRAHKQTVEASAAFAEAGSVFRHFTATAALTPRESLVNLFTEMGRCYPDVSDAL